VYIVANAQSTAARPQTRQRLRVRHSKLFTFLKKAKQHSGLESTFRCERRRLYLPM